uniref:STAM binding protein-like 1 n=1 Tax=Sphaeramia orbicularis TaxID=375764 RepID=A0A673BQR0_9TELE
MLMNILIDDQPDYTDVSLTAAERVRALGKMGCSVEINDDIAPRRYFRSGVEMERMAAVYLDEGRTEWWSRDRTPRPITGRLLAFPRKDELKKRLQEKYSREHSEYLRVVIKVPEVTDGSCLSQQPIREGVRLQGADPNRNRPSAPVSQPAATLAGVHSESTRRGRSLKNGGSMGVLCISFVYFCVVWRVGGVCLCVIVYVFVCHCVCVCVSLCVCVSVVAQRVEGLRRVVIPRDLTYRFLLLADSNTAKGIETCGVLCGRLTHNEFLLTHVVVPKQSAGPDFCDMENVEELFSFQDQQNLLTLGWIHTHPTQTAFLSSVDLHTHCSYQLMLPEAVAIVCAPKHNDSGVFRLTAPGMCEVSSCRLKGFHPHSKDPPLFTVSPPHLDGPRTAPGPKAARQRVRSGPKHKKLRPALV